MKIGFSRGCSKARGAATCRYRGGRDSIELIVTDNGSTDRTAEIAEAAGCKVVPVHRRCIAAARNGGAHQAKGELLAFADADFQIAPATFDLIDEVMQPVRRLACTAGRSATASGWSRRRRLASGLRPNPPMRLFPPPTVHDCGPEQCPTEHRPRFGDER